MFAHILSPRQSVPYQGFPTYLSLAIGLVLIGGSVQVQAANNNPVYNELPVENISVGATDNSPKVVYKRLQTPKVTVDDSKLTDKDFGTMKAKLFVECTQVQSSAARLACFDQVAQQGTTPSYTMTKQPLDIAKTFKTTVTGKPQVILAEEDADTAGLLTNQSASNQSISNDSLDTIGLTEREAQVLEDVGVTQTDIEKYTPLSLTYDLDKNSERGTWTVRPHNPNYILPLFYTVDPNLSPETPSQEKESFTSNEIRNTELKFQLSFKTKVAEDLFGTSADMWFGYTQQSHWQSYNEDNSRPFRATDYQPEVFITQPVTANLPFGGRLRMLGAGAIHHSNGKSDPVSRSWNRAYLMGGAEWGKFSIVPRIWTRIKNENEDQDDNPDIEDFMGHGDVTFLYDLPNQKSLSGTLRYNTKTNRGAAQIDYVYPLTKNVNGYVQLFQGYGESIIDYNYENTAIGVGIVLNDWKGF
ncbi:phospholipase A [Psychrobacter frigidicola]|uniref:phospholipase A n=1 Tax=Psychrobacter frigidicola TaxID=45611 RepID=UPI001918B291|nr:phospholipase A [Psychrobacter frigidicola]